MDQEADTGAPRGSRLEAAVRWGLAAAVLVALAWAVRNRWHDVRDSLGSVPVETLLLSYVALCVGLLGPWRAWAVVLEELGDRLTRRTAAQIFYVGQLGKYVPGAIWPVVVQMRLARPAGVSRTNIALSFMVTLVQGVATGLLVGTLALPSLIQRSGHWAWGLVLAPVAAAALVPAMTSRGLRLLLRVTRRPAAPVEISGGAVGRAVAAYCWFWAWGGLHLWLLVVALGADPLPSVPVCIGALALAMGLGPVFVVLPAGAGVREAVLVTALTTVLSLPAALATALLSRAVVMLGDVTLAAIASVLARRRTTVSVGGREG